MKSRNEKKFEIKLSVEIFKWLEVAIAHDKDRDGEENGHTGAKFSGDEQQGDQWHWVILIELLLCGVYKSGHKEK